MQRISNTWQPLAFLSEKLSAQKATPSAASSTNETTTLAPTSSPAYYRELLAIYEAVQRFHHILEAQHCAIYTSHKLLAYTYQCHGKLPPVQQDQLSFIAQFTTHIEHVSRKDNVVTDALSHVAGICQITADVIAEAQTVDAKLQELLEGGTAGTSPHTWVNNHSLLRHVGRTKQALCAPASSPWPLQPASQP